MDWLFRYHYSDSIVDRFLTTSPERDGIGDLGDVLITPYTVRIEKLLRVHRKIHWRVTHQSILIRIEIAKAGYYSVIMTEV